MQTATRREPANKGQKLPGEVLTADEVAELIRACGKGAAGVRNAGLIATMYGAGLRVSEALALKPSDIKLDTGMIHVQHGKGDKSRRVGMAASLQLHLERWLAMRKEMGFNGRQVVFCTISSNNLGQPLNTSYVRHLLPRLAKKAGIDRRVHPHALRHSLASELAFDGTPLPVITSQLGHSSTAVTDRYLKKVAPADLAALMRSR